MTKMEKMNKINSLSFCTRVFNYLSYPIRAAVDQAGSAFWVLQDCRAALGLGLETTVATEDKRWLALTDSTEEVIYIWAVNDAGLYSLCQTCNSPRSRVFKAWIAEKARPALCRTVQDIELDVLLQELWPEVQAMVEQAMDYRLEDQGPDRDEMPALVEVPSPGPLEKALAALRQAPGGWMAHSALIQKLKLTALDFKALIAVLEVRGQIQTELRHGGGRPARYYKVAESGIR